MVNCSILISEEVIDEMSRFRADYYRRTGIILEDWNEIIKIMLTIIKDDNFL